MDRFIKKFNTELLVTKGDLRLTSFYDLQCHYSKSFNYKPNSFRALPTVPDRILDAPGVVDDFYLNALDWSVRGILAVGLHGTVYLWNSKEGVRELTTFPCTGQPNEIDQEYVSSVAWIHDGKSLAVGSSRGWCHIWDVETSRKTRSIATSLDHRVGVLHWNKHLLSTGSKNGFVSTHDVRVAKSLIWRHVHQGEVCGMKWSPDGRHLVTGSNDNLVRIYDASGRQIYIMNEHKAAIKALAFSPSGILGTGGGSADKTVRLWDLSTGNCRHVLSIPGQASAMVWSKSSRELVCAVSQPTPTITFLEGTASSLNIVGSIPNAHSSRILQVAISPDGSDLVSMSGDETIRFWKCWDVQESEKTRKQPIVLIPPTMPTRARLV